MGFIKTFLGTLLFIIALLLFFTWIFIAYAIYVDASPRGLLGISSIGLYSEQELQTTLFAFVIPPTISLVLFVLLFKIGYFKRGK